MTSLSGKLADLAVQYKSCYAVVKMAAKLISHTKEEQRSVIGVPRTQIHLQMCISMGIKFSLIE